MRIKAQAARPHKYWQLFEGLARELDADRRFFEEHPERRFRLRATYPNEGELISLRYPPPPDDHCWFVLVWRPAPRPEFRLVGLNCEWAEAAEELDDKELLDLLSILDACDGERDTVQ